ncbi:type II secretion system F family protein [Propionivibrio limicola]|uniref:type II secretion system F family protein n=1 Tax=Propionivibrio limicola TaxID=167645 RepID=UPI001290BAD6|nr:type II secretion system F family protein [Propionivibrio limicola]
MFDSIFLFFGVAVFVAVVLGIEGAFTWWNAKRGPEAQRLERRLRSASAGGHGTDHVSILKQRVLSRSEGFQRLLLMLPHVHSLDRIIVQSGVSMTVGDLMLLTLLLCGAGFFVPVYAGRGILFGIVGGLVLASLPILYIVHARTQRMQRMETQLPDAIDLMGRAMRAGHAFPNALKMVGDEMSDPIGTEFRTLFDEINYGVKLEDALLNLLERVPSTDLQYFVVALLIQRETGGNLAELLDNIAAIVRARLKLMGEIRTLSAEGKLSAWILSLLPFATAILINVVNPGFMKVLWTDPFGLNLVYAAVALMVFGIWWMRKIIKIRV